MNYVVTNLLLIIYLNNLERKFYHTNKNYGVNCFVPNNPVRSEDLTVHAQENLDIAFTQFRNRD